MKVFLTVLVLIFGFHSWTYGDDIRDFEIEGMSVGDSLLDYFPKYLIDEAINKSIKLLEREDFKNYNIIDLRVAGKIIVE